MHERGPVSEIVDQLARVIQTRPVTSAEILVGPGIDLSVAVATYEHITTGTDLTALDITWLQVGDTLTCFSCGLDYEGVKLDPCPSCGGSGLVVDPAPDLVLGRTEVSA